MAAPSCPGSRCSRHRRSDNRADSRPAPRHETRETSRNNLEPQATPQVVQETSRPSATEAIEERPQVSATAHSETISNVDLHQETTTPAVPVEYEPIEDLGLLPHRPCRAQRIPPERARTGRPGGSRGRFRSPGSLAQAPKTFETEAIHDHNTTHSITPTQDEQITQLDPEAGRRYPRKVRLADPH